MNHFFLQAALSLCLMFLPAALPPETYSSAKRLEGLRSGQGRDWSPWYVVNADAPKTGFVITHATVELQGDRSVCGNWAVCEPIRIGPWAASYRVKFQGHSEANSVGTSSAVLHVTYTKAQLPVKFLVAQSSDGVFSGSMDAFGCMTERQIDMGAGTSKCSLQLPAPPPGYIIASAAFRMEGDRKCQGDDKTPVGLGSWAHCGQVKRTPTSVIWDFEMQGHTEKTSPFHKAGGMETREVSWGILYGEYRRK